MVMRAGKTKYTHEVHKQFPWISWKECVVCHREFKFETMYMHWWFNGDKALYWCRGCSNNGDRQYLDELIEYQYKLIRWQQSSHDKPMEPPPMKKGG